MKMRGQNSVTIPGNSILVEELRTLLDAAPESATVRFSRLQGDRQFEQSSTTITVEWESDL